MPLNKYFHGEGDSVMRDMKKRYGSERGERVFYATVNKQKAPRYKRRGQGGSDADTSRHRR